MKAKIIKVLQLEVGAGITATYLTTKGTIIKYYDYDEQFFKEFESGFVKYKY